MAPIVMTDSQLHVIRQSCTTRLHSLVTRNPALVFVCEGKKRIQTGENNATITGGSIVILPKNISMSITNIPVDGGQYIAQVLIPASQLIKSVYSDSTQMETVLRATNHPEIIQAFKRSVLAIEDTQKPAVIKEHIVAELLLWLEEEGMGIRQYALETFAMKVRALLSETPGDTWKAGQAARAMAVSEPTLRRKLAREELTFSTLLQQVRMESALGLLQTTHLPISQIANDVGYQSPSRFSTRFRETFGVTPAQVRGPDKPA